MKKTLLVISLAAAGLVAVPALSHAAEDKGGFFINGSVGQSDYSKSIYDDTDTAYNVNLGYRWALSHSFASGIEAGAANLRTWSPKDSAIAANPGISLRDSELKGWTLGANAHYNFTDNWYLSGRAGLFRADAEGDLLIDGAAVRADGKSTEWYAGAGVGYDFTDNFSVGLNYDYYKTDDNGFKVDPGVISASAELRF